jgi:hypothetical protein
MCLKRGFMSFIAFIARQADRKSWTGTSTLCARQLPIWWVAFTGAVEMDELRVCPEKVRFTDAKSGKTPIAIQEASFED